MNFRYTTIALAAMLPALATMRAEDIDTEIKIEREVVPEERAASRLHLLPTLSLPPVSASRLTPNFTSGTVTTDPYLTLLSPAAFATTAPDNRQRGYLDLGFGPAYNLTASAGYRFINNETTSARAWLQFNGSKFHRSGLSLHRNTGTVAAEALHRVASAGGTLKAHIDLGFGSWNNPVTAPDKNTSDLQANVMVGWKAESGSIAYGFGAAYRLTSMGVVADALTENGADIDAEFQWSFNDRSSWGLDAAFSATAQSQGVGTKGIVAFKPFYRYTTGPLTAKLGAGINGSFGSMSFNKEWTVGPDVDIAWSPAASFTLWGHAQSGFQANTLAELLGYTLYIDPAQAFAPAKCNIDWTAGITLGPWRGAAVSLYYRYNSTDGLVAPDPDGGFLTRKARGAMAGVRADYRWRTAVDFHALLEWAPKGSDGNRSRMFAPWLDGARCRFDGTVDVHPIKPLTLTLGYEVRTARRAADNYGSTSALGTYSNLHARISYAFNSSWGVWLEGENLLGKRYLTLPGIPAQGARGMLGITYKLF